MGRPRDDNAAFPVDSLRLKQLNDRHQLMVLLSAMGATGREIALRMDMTEGRVSIIRNSGVFREAVKKIQADMGEEMIKQRIKAIVPQAIDVAHKIMLDETAQSNTRVNTAFKFLDRAYGKPAQELIHDVGMNVRELYEAMDKANRGASLNEVEAIDVTPESDISPLELESLYGSDELGIDKTAGSSGLEEGNTR